VSSVSPRELLAGAAGRRESSQVVVKVRRAPMALRVDFA
jgi:hypothetical protein